MRELDAACPPGAFDSTTIDRFVESEAVGDLLVGWIAENEFATADHDRDVRFAHVKPVEEGLQIPFAIEIDEGVRMAVARQKILDAQRCRAVDRSEQDGVSEATRDQFHSALVYCGDSASGKRVAATLIHDVGF